MRRLVPLVVLAAALLAGGVLGVWGHRTREAVELPPHPDRHPLVESALSAWARGDVATVRQDLGALPSAPPAGSSDRFEVAFLEAAVAGDDAALAELAAQHPETAAGRRAAWLVIERMPPGTRRDVLRTAFAKAHPDAWVIEGGKGRGRK